MDNNTETTVTDEAPRVPTGDHEAVTKPERGVVKIPKEQWTPAMHRKAAIARGDMVVNPTSGLPINSPKLVDPRQLGKGAEG